MDASSLRSIAVALVCAAACARISSEEATPPPRDQAVAQIEPKPEGVAGLAKLSDEAQAYLADCHHRFKKQEEEGDQLIDECLWTSFDQNCAPDPSGCWDKGQECRAGCGKPCESCDDACADHCDGCTGKCAAADEACRHHCAEGRVECRDACLAAREKCSNEDCSAAEEKCNAAHLALREQKCPRCEQINQCMNAAIEKNLDPSETCARKFKREPAECLEWCFEW